MYPLTIWMWVMETSNSYIPKFVLRNQMLTPYDLYLYTCVHTDKQENHRC